MIIMCAKCKKPARIEQRVLEREQVLVITAVCHGAREEMRLSRAELEGSPGLHRQIDAGTGIAFLEPSQWTPEEASRFDAGKPPIVLNA